MDSPKNNNWRLDSVSPERYESPHKEVTVVWRSVRSCATATGTLEARGRTVPAQAFGRGHPVADTEALRRRVWVGSRDTTGIVVRVSRNHTYLRPNDQIVVRLVNRISNVIAMLPVWQRGFTWDFITGFITPSVAERRTRKTVGCRSIPAPLPRRDPRMLRVMGRAYAGIRGIEQTQSRLRDTASRLARAQERLARAHDRLLGSMGLPMRTFGAVTSI